MALRFKKNMYWCWKDKEITKGIIGFTFRDANSLLNFRDKLSADISSDKGLIIQKLQDGIYPLRDTLFGLFDAKDEEPVETFFNKRIPGFFDLLFRHRYYRNWQDDLLSIRKLAKVEIETNHDFSGILIETSFYSSDELSMEINKIAKELGIEIYKNNQLENINIYTNRSLG